MNTVNELALLEQQFNSNGCYYLMNKDVPIALFRVEGSDVLQHCVLIKQFESMAI